MVEARLSTNMALKSRFSDVAIPESMSWPEFVYQKFDEYGDKTAIVSTVELVKSSKAFSLLRRFLQNVEHLMISKVLSLLTRNEC